MVTSNTFSEKTSKHIQKFEFSLLLQNLTLFSFPGHQASLGDIFKKKGPCPRFSQTGPMASHLTVLSRRISQRALNFDSGLKCSIDDL